jgi:hypothetical protein
MISERNRRARNSAPPLPASSPTSVCTTNSLAANRARSSRA